MTDHARFSIDTGVQVYFCDPRSPWQREPVAVGAGFVGYHWCGGFEIREPQREEIVGSLTVERPPHGMSLVQMQRAAGAEQRGDNVRPAASVGQPVECAGTGVDQIEPARRECDHGVADLALDIRDLDAGAKFQSEGLVPLPESWNG